jgi:hypothetical protein
VMGGTAVGVASTSDTEPTERGILGRDVGVFFVTSYHCSPPENLAVDLDHNLDDEKNIFSTWCPVQDLVLRSLRRLARL